MTDFQTSSTLADYLLSKRNQCIERYVNKLYNADSSFQREDILIVRVRSGALIDVLAELLKKNQMERVSAYFQENAQQLLAAGYNLEQIKLMYSLLQESILNVLDPVIRQELNNALSLRSLRSAFQLAQMIAVNQFMAKLNNSISTSPGRKPALPQSDSRDTTTSSFIPDQSLPDTPDQPPPRNQTNRLGRSDGQYRRDQDRPSPGPAPVPEKLSSIGEPGLLGWPLQTVPGSRPPEYMARLADGRAIRVLLVDVPETYAERGIINGNTVQCRVRQIGPVALAYPL